MKRFVILPLMVEGIALARNVVDRGVVARAVVGVDQLMDTLICCHIVMLLQVRKC